jgi:hypothetical protein
VIDKPFTQERMMKIILTFLTLFVSSTLVADTWKSKNFGCSFEYDAKVWTLLPPREKANDLIVGLKNAKGASIVIRIQEDTAKSELTDIQYADYLKQLMVGFNKTSKFVDQGGHSYFGLKFVELKFFQDNAKWGPVLNTYNFHRNGKHMVSLTLTSPRVGDSQKLPVYITEQISSFKLKL